MSDTTLATTRSIILPDTNPSLPPRQTDIKRRSGDHPRIDVKRIRNPEPDEVEGCPLPAFRLDNFQVMIGEEQFFVRETVVVFDFLYNNE